VRLSARGTDEMATLTDDFNDMAAKV